VRLQSTSMHRVDLNKKTRQILAKHSASSNRAQQGDVIMHIEKFWANLIQKSEWDGGDDTAQHLSSRSKKSIPKRLWNQDSVRLLWSIKIPSMVTDT
jgi:hypothetical protein